MRTFTQKPKTSQPDKAAGATFSQRSTSKKENRTGMPSPLKAGLETLSGIDLSGVRVHTNSSKPAQLNALAYTKGQDIHLGPGQENHLPHEGWHAVQQMQGRVKPRAHVNGLSVNDDVHLEREADVMGANALQMNNTKPSTTNPAHLRTLSVHHQAAPLQLLAEPNVKKGGRKWPVVKGDTLWEISKKVYGHTRYINQIKAANPGKNMIVGEVYTLPEIEIPMGTALRDQKGNDVGLRDLAVSISEKDYELYIDSLSQDEHAKEAGFLQLVDMMRSSGMTMAEMVEDQKSSMESKSKADGKSIGELVAAEVAKRGYGGGKATEWTKLTPAEKADYAKRFKAIVKDLETNSPESVMSTIKEAKSHGGRFVWNPEEVEEYGAFAYTAGDWSLYAGQRFVDAVENDPSIAYANVTHEMGGHNEYGDSKGYQIINAVLDKMSATERKKATSGKNSVYSAYGYMETEVWAELREDEFDSDKNPTDRPFEIARKGKKERPPDVKHQLEVIKETFSPAVAEALVRSLYKRALNDDRITPSAFIKFVHDIETVFPFKL